MTLIALTGGIASGKSTIRERFATLGAHVFDADQFARDVVEPGTPALARIRERFGDRVIAEDGSLHRAALGAIVFADPDARAALEDIVHPAVQARAREQFARVRATDPHAVLVYEIPLLTEIGAVTGWDAIVLADADAEVRRERLIRLRGMEPEEAARRIASQADDSARRKAATHVIDTTGSLAETHAQVEAVWRELTAAQSADMQSSPRLSERSRRDTTG